MRIGLFGGSFNPVHLGHLNTIDEVRRAFSLDLVVLIPAAVPPHKPARDMAGAEDRLAMVRLAVVDRPGLVDSDVEIRRCGVSYSIDTINEFSQKAGGEDTDLFFILGMDAFLEIDTWKAYEQFLERISVIVMTRPGPGRNDQAAQRAAIERYLKESLSTGYHYDAVQNAFLHPQREPVFLLAVTPLDISSTQIRQCLNRGKSIRNLVPPSVHDYIQKRGLYR